ncbi:hypothetical protein Aph02nite_41740 [Actinoplanes philippinensis]|uniref:Uncharacterized protein n=1 Tax=Actinoplanes philippinensis TaxID=35752 RepID=A0A1I2GYL6_9ACTN|nr:hypothetical protein [Actinoplanes philippinensis]GIE78224.1 hypothetical protein Aph02nite_41740 [Actinoplanes philippinensis]SFF22512.1 hypothetical protein SAMN05421541_107302 [Actinoplanes philippinensis]
MNKMTRALVMTGVAVTAGVTVAAGPATASSAPGARPAATQQKDHQRRDRIYGFYNSPQTCHRIGRIGQWKNRWERYSCFKVYRGFHSGDWALKVYYGWDHHHGGKHGKGGSYGGGFSGGGHNDYAQGGDDYGGHGQRKS